MKSFFKKLAFVMALAMVITAAAPAAKAAVAAEDKALAIAYQNGMAITEVNLKNVGSTEDLRFLYAPANWKELGADWSSSNNNVATVDENGLVTAVAAGSAIVSVAIGAESASVVVNVVDLPVYTATMGTAENRNITEHTLEEVGDTIDLAFFGIKDYSLDDFGFGLPRYMCKWTSTNPDVASVDEKGLVTAVAPGKAQITLIVANYKTAVEHEVDGCWITVPEVDAPVVEPEEQNIVADINKTQNTFEIFADKNAKINLDTVKVWRVFFADDDYNGDGKIDERDIDKAYEDVYVRDNFYYSAADEAWIVETFDDLIDGVTYEVEVAGFERERFVASVGDVAKVVVLEDTTKEHAALATDDQPLIPGYVYVKLFDAKDVDVTTRVVDGVMNNDASNVVFWLTDETTSDYAMTDYNEISFYEMNTAGVMATFDNNGKEVPSAEPCLITPTEAEEYGIKRVVRWTLVAPGGKADWTKTVDKVPSGEYGYTIATLLEDSRGNYFTTHAGSVDVKYTDPETNETHDVYYTEDENRAFWIYGYRVEYRAMQADNMLVEDYGDVASYEMGKARFALYLYNQFENAEEEFQRELYSQVIEVCHPMQMTDMKATGAVTILTNTEYDEEEFKQLDADPATFEAVTPGVGTAVDNAYYSLYSVKNIAVNLIDIHNVPAKEAHAAEAEFEVTLITGNASDALKTLIEVTYEAELNNDVNNDDFIKVNNQDVHTYATRNLRVEANDFIGCGKSQVKFKITEKITGKSQTITITLKTPELEETVVAADGTTNGIKSAKVATVEEYSDLLKTKLTFEKFVLNINGTSSVLLEQVDRSGNKIGVDNNLHVAVTANPTDATMIAGHGITFGNGGEADLSALALDAGDRVLIITGPDGKIFPSNGTTYGEYKNPIFTTKVPTGYDMPDVTTGLAAAVVEKTGYATSASQAALNPSVKDVDVNQYEFTFKAPEAAGTSIGADEMVYAKAGRYNVTIKTIKAIKARVDANGDPVLNPTTGEQYVDVEYTKSTGVTSTFTLNVTDPRKVAEFSRRELTRVDEDAVIKYQLNSDTIGDYTWAGALESDHTVPGSITKNKEYGDDDNVKELILAAFDFKLGGSAWAENWVDNYDGTYTLTDGNSKLSTEDILYYTYTYTGTNKQVVINTVTFKVADGSGFYRVTATVNKSLTFDFE